MNSQNTVTLEAIYYTNYIMYAEDGIKQESNVRYTLNFNLIAKGGFNSTVFDDEM